MELGDVRLLLTLGGMLVSVVSAFVIVKQRVASIDLALADIEKRLRELDKRVDNSDLDSAKVIDKIDSERQRIDTLRDMFRPEKMDKYSREIERLKVEKEHLRSEVNVLQKMHNGKHPDVPNA